MTKHIRNALAKLREKHKGHIPITAPASNLIELLLNFEKSRDSSQRGNIKRSIGYQLGKLEAALRSIDGVAQQRAAA